MRYEKMSILVVDDSHDVHNIVRVFLQPGGMKNLHFADSAAAAYDILGIIEGGQPNLFIDLILMDIQMTGINGIDATRRIKEVSLFSYPR